MKTLNKNRNCCWGCGELTPYELKMPLCENCKKESKILKQGEKSQEKNTTFRACALQAKKRRKDFKLNLLFSCVIDLHILQQRIISSIYEKS